MRYALNPQQKTLFDPACVAAIIGMRLHLNWIKETEPVVVGGLADQLRWKGTDEPTRVRVIREIDQAAMKKDIFDTLNGKPRNMIRNPSRGNE